jgi:hypothetical protein
MSLLISSVTAKANCVSLANERLYPYVGGPQNSIFTGIPRDFDTTTIVIKGATNAGLDSNLNFDIKSTIGGGNFLSGSINEFIHANRFFWDMVGADYSKITSDDVGVVPGVTPAHVGFLKFTLFLNISDLEGSDDNFVAGEKVDITEISVSTTAGKVDPTYIDGLVGPPVFLLPYEMPAYKPIEQPDVDAAAYMTGVGVSGEMLLFIDLAKYNDAGNRGHTNQLEINTHATVFAADGTKKENVVTKPVMEYAPADPAAINNWKRISGNAVHMRDDVWALKFFQDSGITAKTFEGLYVGNDVPKHYPNDLLTIHTAVDDLKCGDYLKYSATVHNAGDLVNYGTHVSKEVNGSCYELMPAIKDVSGNFDENNRLTLVWEEECADSTAMFDSVEVYVKASEYVGAGSIVSGATYALSVAHVDTSAYPKVTATTDVSLCVVKYETIDIIRKYKVNSRLGVEMVEVNSRYNPSNSDIRQPLTSSLSANIPMKNLVVDASSSVIHDGLRDKQRIFLSWENQIEELRDLKDEYIVTVIGVDYSLIPLTETFTIEQNGKDGEYRSAHVDISYCYSSISNVTVERKYWVDDSCYMKNIQIATSAASGTYPQLYNMIPQTDTINSFTVDGNNCDVVTDKHRVNLEWEILKDAVDAGRTLLNEYEIEINYTDYDSNSATKTFEYSAVESADNKYTHAVDISYCASTITSASLKRTVYIDDAKTCSIGSTLAATILNNINSHTATINSVTASFPTVAGKTDLQMLDFVVKVTKDACDTERKLNNKFEITVDYKTFRTGGTTLSKTETFEVNLTEDKINASDEFKFILPNKLDYCVESITSISVTRTVTIMEGCEIVDSMDTSSASFPLPTAIGTDHLFNPDIQNLAASFAPNGRRLTVDWEITQHNPYMNYYELVVTGDDTAFTPRTITMPFTDNHEPVGTVGAVAKSKELTLPPLLSSITSIVLTRAYIMPDGCYAIGSAGDSISLASIPDIAPLKMQKPAMLPIAFNADMDAFVIEITKPRDSNYTNDVGSGFLRETTAVTVSYELLDGTNKTQSFNFDGWNVTGPVNDTKQCIIPLCELDEVNNRVVKCNFEASYMIEDISEILGDKVSVIAILNAPVTRNNGPFEVYKTEIAYSKLSDLKLIAVGSLAINNDVSTTGANPFVLKGSVKYEPSSVVTTHNRKINLGDVSIVISYDDINGAGVVLPAVNASKNATTGNWEYEIGGLTNVYEISGCNVTANLYNKCAPPKQIGEVEAVNAARTDLGGDRYPAMLPKISDLKPDSTSTNLDIEYMANKAGGMAVVLSVARDSNGDYNTAFINGSLGGVPAAGASASITLTVSNAPTANLEDDINKGNLELIAFVVNEDGVDIQKLGEIKDATGAAINVLDIAGAADDVVTRQVLPNIIGRRMRFF